MCELLPPPGVWLIPALALGTAFSPFYSWPFGIWDGGGAVDTTCQDFFCPGCGFNNLKFMELTTVFLQ